jgi:hypothetical protein
LRIRLPLTREPCPAGCKPCRLQALPAASPAGAGLRPAITCCVEEPHLHARWLNTLSLMENIGARKIARFEHPVKVTTTILKHAAEEFRHAFFLKKQIKRIGDFDCPDYRSEYLLAPAQSRAYLHRLDVRTCRYLKDIVGVRAAPLRYHAYLLVTWAIERRALRLYPLYQAVLEAHGRPLSVRAIIAEEGEHFREMESMLKDCCGVRWHQHAEVARRIESKLYREWKQAFVVSVRSCF